MSADTQPLPEPSRDLRISDKEWLKAFYPWQLQQLKWWLEFRFLEDRCDGVKGPPVAVRFFQDEEEICDHLEMHRNQARQRARKLLQGDSGPWPAGLFWGLQPRLTRKGCSQNVAAFVALACDLDCKDWPELAEEDRPRAAWGNLFTHLTPSVATWSGRGLHGYWLLKEPLWDKSLGETVQKAIAAALRGDNISDSARLLRWPNTVNYKNLMQGHCRLARVIWWRPELRYEIDTLADGFLPCTKRAAHQALEPTERSLWKRFFNNMDRDSALKALWNRQSCGLDSEDRSVQDMALAHSLTRHRFGPEEFRLIATQAPWNADKTLNLGYLERTWKVAQKPQPQTTAPLPGVDFLPTLPESAWADWARVYREAVGPSTEAADEFHYIALLTVVGAALGRTVTVPCGRPIYPNIYAMLVGPTGDRKSTAAGIALDLLRQVAPHVLLLNGVGSQEGLMERMAEADAGNPLHSRTLLYFDEMAAFLKKGRRESSGSLTEFITEIFHAPDFKTHATRSKAIHLNNPTLSILAASTPAWLEAALEEEDILGGFVNRFVFVMAEKKLDNPFPALPDTKKLAVLAQRIRKVASLPARSMGWGPGVQHQWRDFYMNWRHSLADREELSRALFQRIDNYIIKFASIHAAMDEAGSISSTHLSAAIDLGRFLANCTHQALSTLGEPKDTRLERLIEQKLQAQGGSMTRKQLRQLLGGRITGEKLDRILRAMERNGLIRQLDHSTTRGSSKQVQLTSGD